jgi:hypothetical protein
MLCDRNRLGVVVLSSLMMAACSSSSDDSAMPAAGGSMGSGGAMGTGGSTGDATAPADAHLRVAHFAPDAPAVDVCLRPHAASGAFSIGPVLKSLSVTAGLSYPQVTAYVPVPAGQYDVRIVAPNAADCATALAGLPDITDLPSLPAGAYATVAAEGLLMSDAGPGFGLHAYVDDHMVDAAKIKLRFVHASPGTPSVDVGLGTGESFVALFSNVAFGAAGTPAYLETSPVSSATVVARPAGTQTDALVIPGVSIPAGAIVTAFAIGNAAGAPLKTDICIDLDTAKAPLSTCSVLP